MADTKTDNPTVQNIYSLVKKQVDDYVRNQTTISKYVQFNQYENIERIDAYLNSKHISGETDSLGREKPFFNIVTAAVNIWYRATDIDRKDIKLKATNSKQVLPAFLANIYLQEWMREVNYGMFLNEWGRGLARYGSIVTKFVKKGGKLTPIVMPWNRLVCDIIDFDNAPQIERLYYTPAQLKAKTGYDKDQVDYLMQALTTRKLLDNQTKDIKSQFIEVFEVHGVMPLSLITGKKKDDTTYVQQMQVLSYVAKEVKRGKATGYDTFVLASGKEKKSPYYISHLIKEDGRTQAIGAVEHLFNAQWMTNHNAKAIKDQLDLASKLIFQTADANYVGQNALNAIENGDILVHEREAPITQVQNNSHDITALQGFMNQWQALSKEITNTPNAIDGTLPPSGTAYRTVAVANQESHSLFEIMTENKGLHQEEMMREYIIPFLRTQMNNSKEIVATLEDHQITKIDSIYIRNKAHRIARAQVQQSMSEELAKGLSGGAPVQPDIEGIKSGLQDQLSAQGNQRFINPSEITSKTWLEIFDGFDYGCEVEITGESSNKQEVMTSLNTLLQTIATNPAILTDSNAKMLFNKILIVSGEVSPLEITAAQTQQNNAPSPKAPIETISYKDAPDDIRRQMESQAGMKPSTMGQTPAPVPVTGADSKPPLQQPNGGS